MSRMKVRRLTRFSGFRVLMYGETREVVEIALRSLLFLELRHGVRRRSPWSRRTG